MWNVGTLWRGTCRVKIAYAEPGPGCRYARYARCARYVRYAWCVPGMSGMPRMSGMPSIYVRYAWCARHVRYAWYAWCARGMPDMLSMPEPIDVGGEFDIWGTIDNADGLDLIPASFGGFNLVGEGISRELSGWNTNAYGMPCRIWYARVLPTG